MAENNKKSLSYKLQKNPYLLVLIIIVFAVLIFGFAEITSKIQEKKQNQVITTAPVTESEKVEDVSVTEVEKEKNFTNVKKYCSQVGNISFETNESNVIVRAQFKNKDDVLKHHYAPLHRSIPAPYEFVPILHEHSWPFLLPIPSILLATPPSRYPTVAEHTVFSYFSHFNCSLIKNNLYNLIYHTNIEIFTCCPKLFL